MTDRLIPALILHQDAGERDCPTCGFTPHEWRLHDEPDPSWRCYCIDCGAECESEGMELL